MFGGAFGEEILSKSNLLVFGGAFLGGKNSFKKQFASVWRDFFGGKKILSKSNLLVFGGAFLGGKKFFQKGNTSVWRGFFGGKKILSKRQY